MIWIQAGFAMTVLSAAIKSVPDDIVEAAQIDGATGFKLFRKVTVPTIRPAVVVVITTIAMGSLKAFDIVRTMTGGNFGTSVVANEFYTQTFRQGEGRASVSALRWRSSCSSSSFRSSSTTSGRCGFRRKCDEHVRFGG